MFWMQLGQNGKRPKPLWEAPGLDIVLEIAPNPIPKQQLFAGKIELIVASQSQIWIV